MRIKDYFAAIKDSDTLQYANLYELIINMLLMKKEDIRVLEIGVTVTLNKSSEGSATAFCNMPFVSKYVGIDVKPPTVDLPPGATFILGDAYSEDTISKLKSMGEVFDLVIEDGSHLFCHQRDFFSVYRRFCEDVSVMVCEDVPTYTLRKLYSEISDPSIFCVAFKNSNNEILAETHKINDRGQMKPFKSNCFVRLNL